MLRLQFGEYSGVMIVISHAPNVGRTGHTAAVP